MSRQLGEALTIAAEQGLLGGIKLSVRALLPPLLVERAMEKTGIRSASELIEAALAYIVVADEYGDWLIAQRGTVCRDLDLEF